MRVCGWEREARSAYVMFTSLVGFLSSRRVGILMSCLVWCKASVQEQSSYLYFRSRRLVSRLTASQLSAPASQRHSQLQAVAQLGTCWLAGWIFAVDWEDWGAFVGLFWCAQWCALKFSKCVYERKLLAGFRNVTSRYFENSRKCIKPTRKFKAKIMLNYGFFEKMSKKCWNSW